MARYAAHFFFAVAATLISGCQAPQQPTGPTELCVEIPDRDLFIDRTLSILRQRDFQPRFVDRNEALIIAGPTTSGQWLEPWRSDVIGPYQTLEASLHTIRRSVSIEVRPMNAASEPAIVEVDPPPTTRDAGAAAVASAPSTAGSEPYRLRVTVEKTRLAAPNRQATTAIGLLGIYSARMPTTEGLRGVREEQWVPLGRDGLLEADLLRQISRELTPIAQAAEPATEPEAEASAPPE